MARQNDTFPEIWVQFIEFEPVDGWLDNFDHRFDHRRFLGGVDWIPPECPEGFVITRTWPWHIFTETPDSPQTTYGFQEASPHIGYGSPLPSHIELHDTTSIVFSSEINHFFEVPYDCTREHVVERRRAYSRDGWNRVTFQQVTDADERVLHQHPHLWKIGHAIGARQIDRSVYISDSWNNLILPGSFYNGVRGRNTLPTCELAGKLTMLLGLVAFATRQSDLIAMVQDSFRYKGTTHYVPNWVTRRETDQGLEHKRGIIVKVAFDTEKHTKQQIERWECGYHGPILTSNEDWNRTPRPRMPTQPAQLYGYA